MQSLNPLQCDLHKFIDCPYCHSDISSEIKSHLNRLWAELHLKVDTFEQLVEWKKKLNIYACDCNNHLTSFIERDSPPENNLFEWGVRLHNSVNDKLRVPNPSLIQAYHIWRKKEPVYRERDQPLVSSVSPKNPERQLTCIRTWLASGFKVILIQNENELGKCQDLYDLPVEWKTCKTPRPLIYEMLYTGVVINSDCEISGYGPDFGDKPQGLLRWNYNDNEASSEEAWGIDCWYIPKHLLHHLPEDLPYMIGKPFWDYAVPALLSHNEVPFFINHTPWIHHKLHPLNWNDDDWYEGYKYISAKLPGREYGDDKFRKSIDTLTYDNKLGRYV